MNLGAEIHVCLAALSGGDCRSQSCSSVLSSKVIAFGTLTILYLDQSLLSSDCPTFRTGSQVQEGHFTILKRPLKGRWKVYVQQKPPFWEPYSKTSL